MQKFGVVLGMIVGLSCAQRASADLTTLQDVIFNVNGTVTQSSFAVGGLATGGFDEATGVGTLTLTYNPGPGTYFVDVWFDHDLSLPFYNEFGAVSGAPVAGQSYQIDNPDTNVDANRTGNIQANTAANTLDNTNHISGNTSNFNTFCGANSGGAVNAACNNDVSMGMGYAFTLAAGQQETITWTLSHTAPASGFFLEQIHPQDAAGPESDLFFQGSAVSGPAGGPPPPPPPPPPSGVPEPGYSVLLAGFVSVMLLVLRRRARTASQKTEF